MVHSTPMQMVLPGLDFSPLEGEEKPLDEPPRPAAAPTEKACTTPAEPVVDDVGVRSVERVAEMFAIAFRELKPRTELPAIDVQFRAFAGASARVRLLQGRLEIKLSDMLEDAPDEALGSLAFILLSKLYRRPVVPERAAPYREFLADAEVRNRIGELRRERGRKVMGDARGIFFDLQEIFDRLNAQYFGGQMRVDALGWSRQFSRTTLGHYDLAHNAIVVSRILDRPLVPQVAVDFLMYHEMLHVRYPVEHGGPKRRIHTREFRVAERQFEQYAEAKAAIRQLLGGRLV